MAKSNRQHFLAIFIMGSVGFLLTLSLIPTGTNPNLLGNFGSGFSYFLYTGFGLCAWVFPLVLFYLAYARFKDKAVSKAGFKLVGLILTVLSTSVLFRVILPNIEMREGAEWGGELGKLFGDPMTAVLTRFGTVVICLLIIVLALWFLEAEDHVVKGLQGAGDGFKKGGGWFKEHGFNVFAVLYEGVQKSIEKWTSRQDQKRVVEDAHRKLQGETQAIKASPKVEKVSKPVPLVPTVETKPEKATKPATRKLFTGEAEPAVPEPVSVGACGRWRYGDHRHGGSFPWHRFPNRQTK